VHIILGEHAVAILSKMTIKLRFTLIIAIISTTSILQGVVLFSSNSDTLTEASIIADVEIPLLNKAHELKLAVVQVQQWLPDISARSWQ
jgi:methyl-accepting chemotaxis protein